MAEALDLARLSADNEIGTPTGIDVVQSSSRRLGPDGRISLPAAYRRRLGLNPGDRLIVQLEVDGIRLTSPKLAIERARRIIDRYVTSDESLADALIADRRAGAARE